MRTKYRFVLTMLTVTLAVLTVGDVSPLVRADRARAQPEPTLEIVPPSGPCDATLEVTGQEFPPNTAIELGVGGIGGQSIEGRLASVFSDANGHLSFNALLGFLGCGMASVTRERTGGDQLWLLGYAIEPGPSGRPTARILARAPYTFTTTQSTLPEAILTLSPSSGPCDATVDATGAFFEPGSNVMLQVARPHSEGFLGTVGQVSVDANGRFVTTFTFGTVGCQAAALDARANASGEPNELRVCGVAYQASRCATYAYSTTVGAAEGTPTALPRAGGGGTSSRSDVRPLAVFAALFGVALLACGVLVARRRAR